MASITQTAPSITQPVINALVVLAASLNTFGQQNGLTNLPSAAAAAVPGQGSLSPIYVQYAQLTNIVQLLLSNFRSGQSMQTIQKTSGSLYEVAAQIYGDVTQAFTLMEVDDFCTPWLPTSVNETINLPPSQTASPSSGFSPTQATP